MSGKGDCSSCGLPLRLSESLDWREGGNIYTRFKPRRQVIILEHRELQMLLGKAEERGGEELMRRLATVRRRYLRHRTAQQAEGVDSCLLRGRRLGRRAVLYALQEARLFGLGRLEVEELEGGKRLTITVEHPYHPQMLAADICGFWEGLFRVRAEEALEQKGAHSWRLRLMSGGELSQRFMEYREITEKEAGKRNRGIERCPACRLPVHLSHLQWDSIQGTIYDPERDRYHVVVEVAGMDLLIKEMRSFLGRDYGGVARSAFAASLGDGSPGSPSLDPGSVVEEWPALGWGEAEGAARRPFLEEMEVRSPALPSMAEHKLAALYQLRWGEEVDSSLYRGKDGLYRFAVYPRLIEYSMNLETLRQHFPQLEAYPLSFLPF